MREQTARVLADAAYVAGGAQGVSAVRDVLALTARVTHHEAAALIVWDPLRGRHRDLLSEGYSLETLVGLGDRYAASPEHRRMRTTKYPLRIDDLPYDYRKSDIFHELMEPSGFSEGMTACLFRADDLSYRGMMHFSASAPGRFDDEAVELIAALTTVIARLCSDVLDAPPQLHGDSRPRVSIVDDDGGASTVGGFEPARCVLQPSFLSFLRRFRAAPAGSARGLWPSAGGWLAVEVQKVRDDLSPRMRVEERDLEGPFGLSPRELDILQGVASGDSNQQIALARSISLRTVTTHVERLLQKTEQPSRAGLVALAARHGLLALAL